METFQEILMGWGENALAQIVSLESEAKAEDMSFLGLLPGLQKLCLVSAGVIQCFVVSRARHAHAQSFHAADFCCKNLHPAAWQRAAS